MDFIRKLSLLTLLWAFLFLAFILTNNFGKSVSLYTWIIYSLVIGLSVLGLKLWNRTLQEPVLDINLTYTEMSISVLLAILVSLVGGVLMHFDSIASSTPKYFLLTFVVTTSQFTLLKVSGVSIQIISIISMSTSY